jgi:hypothetical protein
MNRLKNYLMNQAARSNTMLTYDIIMVGGFMLCIYYGFIE